ncbi:MAG: dTMP kinase [Parvularcula sp.]
MTNGAFIAFEGPEGAGKTTQLERLADRVAAAGRKVVQTREPGGTEQGEALRALLLDPSSTWSPIAEALLMNAARSAHLSEVIEPALARGDVVLTDRFSLSTLAYQGGQVDAGLLAAIEDEVVTIRPDLVLVFDLPPEEGLRRAAARSRADRFEARPASFHRAVADRFKECARMRGYPIIDATGPAEAVEARVLDAIKQGLPNLLGDADD